MDILCMGMISADVIAVPVNYHNLSEDTIPTDIIDIKSGGDCMNVAVCLGKLGCDTSFCGRIGDDWFGAFLRDALIRNNVDIRGLICDPRQWTARCVALINEEGQRIFLYCGSANSHLVPDDLPEELLAECRHLHMSGIMQLTGLDGPGCAAVMRKARALGKTTSLDITWDSKGRWLSVIAECLPYVDIFIPSETEAQMLTNLSDPKEIATFFLDRGVGTVILKMGDKGAYVQTPSESFFQPAFSVPVVDTTGAGDSFVGGFLAYYARGASLRESVRFATAVAAHCVGTLGATDGVPSREVVEQFLQDR